MFAKRSGITKIAELIGHEQGFTLSVYVYAPMQLPMPALSELTEREARTGHALDHLHV